MTDARVSNPWHRWTVTLGLMALCATVGCSGSTPPNIVLIYIDDLGWRDLGIMGSQYYETPNIDALAASKAVALVVTPRGTRGGPGSRSVPVRRQRPVSECTS